MITCTKLSPRGRHRFLVEVVIFDQSQDVHETMILSDKDVFANDLREGDEIPEQTWNEIQSGLLHSAIEKCGKLLADMDYSRQGMTQKLARTGYPENIARTTADLMVDAGYIDDCRMAQTYLQYHIEDRSLLRIRHDLQQKGVPQSVVEDAIRTFTSQDTDRINLLEQNQILSLLRKRHFDPDDADAAQIHKTIAFLMNKGYSLDNIHAAMKDAKPVTKVSESI